MPPFAFFHNENRIHSFYALINVILLYLRPFFLLYCQLQLVLMNTQY